MHYRRADTAGGTYFFMVNLVERSADLLVRHVDYSHYNPVKHGWVSRAVEWPHSTLHSYIERGMAWADWGGAADQEVCGYGER